MTKKILLFLLFPLFIFASIEIATKPIPPKSEEKQEQPPQSTTNSTIDPSTPLETDEQEEQVSTPTGSPSFLETGYQKQFFRTLVFFFLFILFGMLAIFIYRRGSNISTISKRNSRNNIKILERRSLSPQTYLYHIQIGDKQFILAESKVDVRNVADLDWLDKK
jgi:flagellar biogenesis protein FliO